MDSSARRCESCIGAPWSSVVPFTWHQSPWQGRHVVIFLRWTEHQIYLMLNANTKVLTHPGIVTTHRDHISPLTMPSSLPKKDSALFAQTSAFTFYIKIPPLDGVIILFRFLCLIQTNPLLLLLNPRDLLQSYNIQWSLWERGDWENAPFCLQQTNVIILTYCTF